MRKQFKYVNNLLIKRNQRNPKPWREDLLLYGQKRDRIDSRDKGGMTHKRKWNEISDNRTTAGHKLISKLCKKKKKRRNKWGWNSDCQWVSIWVYPGAELSNASQSEVTPAKSHISGLRQQYDIPIRFRYPKLYGHRLTSNSPVPPNRVS